MYKIALLFSLLFLFCASCSQQLSESQTSKEKSVSIVLPEGASARVKFGAQRLAEALEGTAYKVETFVQDHLPESEGQLIVIGELEEELLKRAIAGSGVELQEPPGKEGFSIYSRPGITIVGGADNSGTLYGSLELAERIKKKGEIPPGFSMTDQPEMVLRGAAIGVQKTAYLPGRNVYEYPYTPENFPWFYDKELWIRYLDMLVDNRMNSLYLWNGHPFASLVKLEDYPYAVEVDRETFQKNEEMFQFLTEEADKRGIWVIQMFYNILLSKPFAEKHGLKTQDRSRPITPLIADYTRKSIAAFVEKYPNVGLLVTLGEAMTTEDSDVPWFTETIIPAVQDGLKALGKNEEPPIVLRGHDTNPQQVMQAALPLYKNLYTMNKYNGEALTTYEPRGPWAKMHRELSELGSTHIENVHILANLEPFRYGSADFIQKSVQAMHEVHGANGLHLYPESSYWDWPYTADKVSPRLLQIDRDKVWYEAWARYAWNCHRDREEEFAYWSNQLAQEYGCSDCGGEILEAYEQAGEISPKLLRRFGITNGNRQTLTLGMFMSQLVNPHKWRVWPHLYDSDGPEGETLAEYVEKEWKQKAHRGETPAQIIEEVEKHAEQAVSAIDKAAPHISRNEEEFGRLKNDIYSYHALANFFSQKVQAAQLVLRYQYSKDIKDLEQALPHLEKSVDYYQDLVRLTKDHYLYANSMQTAQRRIPIGGDEGKNKTWEELLPHYAEELENFKKNIRLLKASETSEGEVAVAAGSVSPVKAVQVSLIQPVGNLYKLEAGKRVFTDNATVIKRVAEELKNMEGIPLSLAQQRKEGTFLQFENEKPVKVLVGFFQSRDKGFLAPPDLETDAAGNAHGQAQTQIQNALQIEGWPTVNVHTYYFEKGRNNLSLAKGAVLVLGFIEGSAEIGGSKTFVSATENREGLDWLFD